MTLEDQDSLLTPDPALLEIDDDDLFIKPKKKMKILMLADHTLSTSGVGTQANFLIHGLLNTGKYSFRVLGGAMKHADYRTIKVNDDYFIKPVNGFGTKEMMKELLVEEKPDAVFLFTDPRQFIWVWEMEDEIHQICPIVYWTIWDNAPTPVFNKAYYDSTDLLNCISKVTHEMISTMCPEKTNYIPHGLPSTLFYPMPNDQIESLKKQNFGDRADWFKMLWVNRNATRKMPGDVLLSWKMFLDDLEKKHGHRKAVLIMHTDPKDQEGPDLLSVAAELKLQNHVWFSTDKLEHTQMNVLHNMVEGVVNISKAEGFGLSTLASLQVGKPVVVLCTGGETDKAIDPKDGFEHGVALKPVKKSLVGSQMVPYIFEDFASTEEVAAGYMKLYEMTPEEKEHMKQRCTSFINENFKYEDVVRKWDETLEKCIVEFKEQKSKNEGRWSLTDINTIVDSSVVPNVK